MDVELNETCETWGSSENDHKMAVFWDLMSREQFTILLMEAAGSSENLYTSTGVHDIAYKQT